MIKTLIYTTTFFIGSSLFATDAQTLIKENGCFACHALASKKSAPAFKGVAMRNKRFNGSNAKASIMNSIKNGSEGKYRHFIGAKMPAFSNLTQADLTTLADYILSQGSKGGSCGHGGGMGMRRGGM